MHEAARVRNVELLADLRGALLRFGHEAGLALDSVDGELRKTHRWLEDQARYWQNEIRRWEETVFVAKQELARKRMRMVGDQPVNCWEEEQRLRNAKSNLEHASDRLDRVRHWLMHWSHETIDYEGPSRQLKSFIEGDLLRAAALLESKSESLDAYLSVAAPERRPATAGRRLQPETESHRSGTANAPEGTEDVEETGS